MMMLVVVVVGHLERHGCEREKNTPLIKYVSKEERRRRKRMSEGNNSR